MSMIASAVRNLFGGQRSLQIADRASIMRRAKSLLQSGTVVSSTDDDFWHAQIDPSDRALTKYSIRPDQYQMIMRASGYVNICASLRSIYTTNVPLRVFTKARGRAAKRYNVRPVKSKSRREWLRNPALGQKAIQHADNAGDVVEVPDHPLLQLLQNPNEQDTGVDFRRAMHFYRLVAGNAYPVCVADNRGRPIKLRQFMPQWTVVLPGVDDIVGGFGYGRNRGDVRVWDARDVAHMRYRIAPLSPLEGVGPLHGIVPEADTIAASTMFELHLWNNSARPDYAVKVAKGTSPDTIKQIKEFLRRNFRGVRKAGEPLVADDLEVTPLQFNQREMQYTEGRVQLFKLVKDAYGMCGILDEQGGAINIGTSGISSNETMFYRVTVIPDVVSECETWTEKALPWFGDEPGEVWVGFDNPVPDDIKAMTDRHVARCNAGLSLIDECRAEVGDPPLPDGMGAIPRYNGQPMTKEPPQPLGGFGGGFGGGGGVQAFHMFGGGKSDEKGDEGAKRLTAHLKHSRLYCGDWDHHGCNHGRKDRMASDLVTREEFRAMVQSVQAWLQSINPSVEGNQVVFDVNATEQAFMDAADPSLRLAFSRGFFNAQDVANAAADRAGVNVSALSLSPETMQTGLQTYKVQLAREVTQTAQDRMNAILSSAMDGGMLPKEAAASIQDALGGEAYYIADRIARTELAVAQQTGSQEAWKQAGGVVVGKRFVLAPGACELCQAVARELDGKVIPLDQPLIRKGSSITVGGRTVVFDFRDVTTGTVHPNDRCTIEPVFEWEVSDGND